MSQDVQNVTWPSSASSGEFFVPGTCFVPHPHNASPGISGCRSDQSARDPAMRKLYLSEAMADIPRLLGAIDRNPFSPTYGCLDRQFWHYRTSSFPSQMYQEGALPLALVYCRKLPGNRWYLDGRVRELAVAAIRFAAASSHADGSCDDYYPFERALGAAAFSLAAAVRAYRLLELNDPLIREWFRRRARWLINHDESAALANHQALAALGLLGVAQLTGERVYGDAAAARIAKLLAWQSDEGWFEEYGGADPGYQTVTIDCLAQIRKLGGDVALDEPLRKAAAFARWFLHDDGSFAGEYGSRGTYHFYPHGLELLAAENTDAAELADGFLRGLAAGKHASFSDDRMFIHRLGSLIEAYLDWSPVRPAAGAPAARRALRYFRHAGLLVRRTQTSQTIISAARGGVFKHFVRNRAAVTDAGLVVETRDGRVAASEAHDLSRVVEDRAAAPAGGTESTDCRRFSVSGRLGWSRFDRATPIKQALFHAGMTAAGRWCRTAVRRWLQRRLITARRRCPIRLTRCFEFLPEPSAAAAPRLRVSDTIELLDRGVRVRRMSFGADHQTAYVAAANVYQDSVLQPWTDLAAHVEELNTKRRVTIVREF